MSVTLFRVMIDTCIWLDLARNYRSAPLVRALYEMCDNAQLEIIVPDIVREEFKRNKGRVLSEAGRSLQSTLKTLKSALPTFIDPIAQKDVLDTIQGLDFTSATGGIPSIVEQVEELMDHPENIEVESSIYQKARAATRAIDKQAPCHQGKNSVADAVLFEIYDELRTEPHRDHIAYGFASSNHKDFSESNGDTRQPHSDLKYAFNDRSLYIVDIGKFVEAHAPEMHGYFEAEHGLFPDFRSLGNLVEVEDFLARQVWYNRHMNRRLQIEEGMSQVVTETDCGESPQKPQQILDTYWRGALEEAKKTEDEIGIENLGPWDDFEWGMLNGKLSAVRWVLGDEWDMLDT